MLPQTEGVVVAPPLLSLVSPPVWIMIEPPELWSPPLAPEPPPPEWPGIELTSGLPPHAAARPASKIEKPSMRTFGYTFIGTL